MPTKPSKVLHLPQSVWCVCVLYVCGVWYMWCVCMYVCVVCMHVCVCAVCVCMCMVYDVCVCVCGMLVGVVYIYVW